MAGDVDGCVPENGLQDWTTNLGKCSIALYRHTDHHQGFPIVDDWNVWTCDSTGDIVVCVTAIQIG